MLNPMCRLKVLVSVLAVWLLAGVALPSPVRAALFYQSVDNIGGVQTGLVITPLDNGNNLWNSSVQFTNNNSQELELYWVTTSLFFQGQPAQWNDSTALWTGDGFTARAANSAFSLSMDRAVTDLGFPSGFGVTTESNLPAFLIGTLAPSASAEVFLNYEVSAAVNELSFGGGIVAAVPEPSSLPAPVGLAVGLALGHRPLRRGAATVLALLRRGAADGV